MQPIARSGAHSNSVITGKETIPTHVSSTGTMDTNGTIATEIYGTDTDFSKVNVGDFLYSVTNNEIREVMQSYVGSGVQRLSVRTAFSAPLVGENFKYVVSKTLVYVGITNTGNIDGTVGGAAIAGSSAMNFEEQTGLQPFVVDGTGTTLQITTQ